MITKIDFVPGDTVKVYQKIKEGEKTRLQMFEGVVLQIRGRNDEKMFTVKKVVGGVMVERIWSVKSPLIDRVVIKSHSKTKVRRAKLYHLRNKK